MNGFTPRDEHYTILAAAFVGCCVGWIAAFAYLSRHDGRPKFAGVLTDVRRMERDRQEHVKFVVELWKKKFDEHDAGYAEQTKKIESIWRKSAEDAERRFRNEAAAWGAGRWTVDEKTGEKWWQWTGGRVSALD